MTSPKATPEFSDDKAPRAERLMLYALGGFQLTYVLDFMIMTPLGPFFTRALGISVQQFSFLVAAYTFSAAVAGIFATSFIDRFERRTLILSAYALFMLATLSCAFVPGYWSLMVARCLAGIFGGTVGAMIHVCVGEYIPFARRGRAMGLVMSAFSLASVAGIPLGLLLASQFGFRAPFLFIALVGLFVLTFAFRVLPRSARKYQTPAPGAVKRSLLAPMADVLRVPNHLLAFTFAALMIFTALLMFPYMPLYLTSNVGITEAQLPLTYLCGGAMTLFTARIIGRMADKFGKQRVFRWLALLAFIPVLTMTNLGRVPLWVVLIVSTLMMVLMSGRMIPSMALITGSATPSMRGAFMSMNSTVQSIASGLAVLVGGAILVQEPDGTIRNFNFIGYGTVAVSLIAIWLSSHLKVMPDSHAEIHIPEEKPAAP